MSEHFPLTIGNTIAVADESITVFSPYDNSELATVDLANEQQVDEALAVAHGLFRDKTQWLSVPQRIAILTKAASLMSGQVDYLGRQAASEGGKPLADSIVEVKRVIDGIELAIDTIRNDVGEVVPMTELSSQHRRMAMTQKEPIGVVVAVSAFNHPLNLIAHQVGAAIAAGCPTIVKPADITPISCFRFVNILREAGLPTEWCQVILPKNLDLATKLVSDSRVGFFSFIGSAKVGWMLRSKLAPGTRCALEHGGVAPLIMDSSADINKAIPDILKGGYYHAGQVCVSVQRVFIHAQQFDEVAAALKLKVEALQVGDPLAMDTQVGPLIRKAEAERIDEWVQEAIKAGAVLATGGKMLANNCYAPTLLLNPPVGSKVSVQEIFGPVVCLYSYENIDSAIQQANSLPFAFQASVYAQDLDAAVNIYHKLDASAVMVNDHTAFRQDGMPFAGLRQSGLGVGGVPHTIEEMQINKMLVLRTANS